MEKFELQKPISQLLNGLKSQLFLRVNILQIGCSEQLKKSHNFTKIIFVTSSSELYSEYKNHRPKVFRIYGTRLASELKS